MTWRCLMPVLAAIDLKVDDLEALIAAKKELMDPVADPLFAEHGHRWQVVVRTDQGVRLLNLWDSEEGRDRANNDPGLVEAREAVLARTGAQANYSSYPVLAIKTTTQDTSHD
jgi:hypothetical protein